MKCPICGNDMESGFIQSGQGMIWSSELKESVLLPNFDIGDIRLRESFWHGTRIDSDICKSCKIIITRYDKLTNTTK